MRLRSQFRTRFGSEVGVDLSDARSTPGTPKLAVFANTRPRGSDPKGEMDSDVLDVPSNVPSTTQRDACSKC